MAAKSDAWAEALLKLLFQNVDAAGIGDAGGLLGSVVDGAVFVALHTASPGTGGNQSTNEVSYNGYARVSIARNATEWDVVGTVLNNLNNIIFPTNLGGGGEPTATHFSIGIASAGATMYLYRGTLSPSIACTNGSAPTIVAGTLSGTET